MEVARLLVGAKTGKMQVLVLTERQSRFLCRFQLRFATRAPALVSDRFVRANCPPRVVSEP